MMLKNIRLYFSGLTAKLEVDEVEEVELVVVLEVVEDVEIVGAIFL